jgi:hypothetical protein
MNEQRYRELMGSPDAKITDEEWEEGWHYCPDWDFLLIGPETIESEACTCYKTGGAIG